MVMSREERLPQPYGAEPPARCSLTRPATADELTGSTTSVPCRKLSRLFLLFYAIGCSDLGEVVGERGQDLVGGLGPGERPGVVVPGGDPVPDVVLQGLDGGVHAAADQLVCQQAEPSFDLVHPGRAGRGEVNMEARVPGQPGPDLGGVVGGVVVADQVHVQSGGHGLVDP